MITPLVVQQGIRSGASPSDRWDDLYRRHASTVHRYCVFQVGPDIAEDLTHETFLRAFAIANSGPPLADEARALLITIAKNLCTDHHRRNGRWQRILGRLHHSTEPSTDVAHAVEVRKDVEEISRVVTTLRMRDRQLIALRAAADLSYRDIAAVLGDSEQVVKVATHRAFTRLRARLASSGVTNQEDQQ